ncbi:hypothetical protein HYZ97_00080 [Candidatus Pacearchaeota archaeon]|nr:hypothetical protein [Candidatus Pacearchaeota archaeon]
MSTRTVKAEYLRAALSAGTPEIRVTSPIIHTGDGNYFLSGVEIGHNGTHTKFNATLSRTEYLELAYGAQARKTHNTMTREDA